MSLDNIKKLVIMGEKVPDKIIENTEVSKRLVNILALAISAILVGACATTSQQSLDDTVKALEREVVQLNSERVNWEARYNAMDDQVLVLKKKLERCQEGDRQDLKVVRLIPGEQQSTLRPVSDTVGYGAPFEAPQSGNRIGKQKKRQVLVLRGNRSYPSGSQVSGQTNAKPSVNSEAFQDLAPDNLGVVKVASEKKDQVMETFNAAYRAYSNRQYDKALTMFSTFVNRYQSHDFADNAIFWRGECYLATGQFFKAIGEFERLLRRYSGSDKRPSSLYRIGFAWDKLGDKDKALEYYFRVVGSHAGTDAARRASRRVSAIQGEGGQASSLMPTAQAR
jgi:tol-pal system protein YbgF